MMPTYDIKRQFLPENLRGDLVGSRERCEPWWAPRAGPGLRRVDEYVQLRPRSKQREHAGRFRSPIGEWPVSPAGGHTNTRLKEKGILVTNTLFSSLRLMSAKVAIWQSTLLTECSYHRLSSLPVFRHPCRVVETRLLAQTMVRLQGVSGSRSWLASLSTVGVLYVRISAFSVHEAEQTRKSTNFGRIRSAWRRGEA